MCYKLLVVTSMQQIIFFILLFFVWLFFSRLVSPAFRVRLKMSIHVELELARHSLLLLTFTSLFHSFVRRCFVFAHVGERWKITYDGFVAVNV